MENLEPTTEPIKIPKVQTYADDMVGALQDGGENLVKNIIQEQAQQEHMKRAMTVQSRKNILYMILAVLIVLSAVAGVVALFVYQKKNETVEVAPRVTPILFTDKTELIAIEGYSKRDISSSVKNLVRATTLELGKIREISLTENGQSVGLERFLKLTEGNFPIARTDLVRNFFMGVLGRDVGVEEAKGGELFFLLKVISFNDVFATMGFWEKKMFGDLYDFFGIDINPENTYLLTKDFEDGIVENKNARVLYDNNRNIVFAYVFIDDKTIVISTSSAPVREVILRLTYGEVRK